MLDRAGRAAVAEVQRDDPYLFARDAAQLAVAIGHVAVGRAVEPVPADLEPPVVLVRDPVQVRHLGQARVERGVEHRDLRHAVAQELARRADALEVGRVVQRRQLDAILDARDHGLVDAHRGPEALPAVDHTVSDRVNVRDRAHRLDPGVG